MNPARAWIQVINHSLLSSLDWFWNQLRYTLWTPTDGNQSVRFIFLMCYHMWARRYFACAVALGQIQKGRVWTCRADTYLNPELLPHSEEQGETGQLSDKPGPWLQSANGESVGGKRALPFVGKVLRERDRQTDRESQACLVPSVSLPALD